MIQGTSTVEANGKVTNVQLSEDSLTVGLADGRSISVPLAWYPRLLHATAARRAHWKIAGGRYGIHWPNTFVTLPQNNPHP